MTERDAKDTFKVRQLYYMNRNSPNWEKNISQVLAEPATPENMCSHEWFCPPRGGCKKCIDANIKELIKKGVNI